MTPPLHVKVVAVLANFMPLMAGVRNVFMPGTPLSLIPEDEAFQRHFHGEPGSNPVMAFAFQLFGVALLSSVAAKLVTIFGGSGEGTYLRQQLLLVLGIVDVGFAGVVFAYGGLDKAVTQGFACALLFEGAVFVADAVLRKRAPKAKAKAA